jgi:hypothetical protein
MYAIYTTYTIYVQEQLDYESESVLSQELGVAQETGGGLGGGDKESGSDTGKISDAEKEKSDIAKGKSAAHAHTHTHI